ncbi:MAG: prenyltransferase/squalene oxidase repeat-containing protein [Pirellulaceae bacterium]
MPADWKSAFADGQILEKLNSTSGPGMTLWLGLGILTISLLVLMRTRWGQAKPLSKCIVLSVFAHILFITYAYGTRLILDQPAPPREHFIQFSIIAPEEDWEETQNKDTDAWQESFPTAVVQPDVELPDRKTADIEIPDAPSDLTASDFRAQPGVERVPEDEPEREHEEPSPTTLAATTEAAPSDLEIESTSAERQDTPPLLQPDAMPLERLQDKEPPDSLLPLDSTTVPPPELFQDTTQLQRLSDIDAESANAEAVHERDEETRRADNRDAVDEEMPAFDTPSDVGFADANQQPGTLSVSSGTPSEILQHLPVVRRLGDSAPLPDLYLLRSMADRLPIAKRLGATEGSEAAVQAALAWLVANQESDGRWNARSHGAGREDRVRSHDRQHAGVEADTGITGLALLSFLGAGHTHFEGTYRKSVQHGLEYLIRNQTDDGSLAGQATLFARMYCHGIASLALSEAYVMTGDYRLKPHVEIAAQFTVGAQIPATGGWRYQQGDPVGDMSQFGWQVMALTSAQRAGVEIPERTRARMARYLRSASTGASGGLVGYRPGDAASRTMTAEALACRFFLGRHDSAGVREAVRFLMQETPQNGQANLYYWYYATMSLFQAQGESWPRWNTPLQQQLLKRQRTDGSMAGSWDPDTVWGGYGGRVYSTGLATLCLEVYYRYLPVLNR